MCNMYKVIKLSIQTGIDYINIFIYYTDIPKYMENIKRKKKQINKCEDKGIICGIVVFHIIL